MDQGEPPAGCSTAAEEGLLRRCKWTTSGITCNQPFQRAVDLFNHLKNHLDPMPESMICHWKICHRKSRTPFYIRTKFMRHLETHTKSKPDMKREYTLKKSKQRKRDSVDNHPHKTPICNVVGCAQSFSTVTELINHLQSHEGTTYGCPNYLNAMSKSRVGLWRPWLHGGIPSNRKRTLQRHPQTHTEIKPNRKREYTLQTSNNLQRDPLHNHPHMTLICNVIGCSQSFSTDTELINHLQSHEDNTNGCQNHLNSMPKSRVGLWSPWRHGGIPSNRKHTLQPHPQTHTKIKPNRKRECTLQTSNNLQIGKSNYLQRDTFDNHPPGTLICNVIGCAEPFSTYTELINHLESHEGNAYGCQVAGCGLLFKDLVSFQEHRISHQAPITIETKDTPISVQQPPTPPEPATCTSDTVPSNSESIADCSSQKQCHRKLVFRRTKQTHHAPECSPIYNRVIADQPSNNNITSNLIPENGIGGGKSTNAKCDADGMPPFPFWTVDRCEIRHIDA